VRIHDIQLRTWQPPRLTLAVECDPGTYIRSLTHDLGQALGCGAMLTALVRTRSGQFRVEEAVTPDALEAAFAAGNLAQHLHPLQAALSALAAVLVAPAEERLLRRGQPIPCPVPPASAAGYAITPAGEVMAILAHDAESAVWRPNKVFVTGEDC
jgi:tRNA pseudouridine55 synthase